MFRHLRATKWPSTSERGFTIVELMIATLVFSVILTVITAGVISFTNQYYRGVNASATQNAARSALDTITQAIQFGVAPVQETGSNSYFCAGGYAFTYAKGDLYTGLPTDMGLYVSPAGATCAAIAVPPSGGKQLLSKNMRLTQLSVAKVGDGLYKVSIGVAYGSVGDMFCSESLVAGSCAPGSSNNLASYWADDLQCRSGNGSQYCYTSKLTTVVEQRIGA